jgi:hypothetical protein
MFSASTCCFKGNGAGTGIKTLDESVDPLGLLLAAAGFPSFPEPFPPFEFVMSPSFRRVPGLGSMVFYAEALVDCFLIVLLPVVARRDQRLEMSLIVQ